MIYSVPAKAAVSTVRHNCCRGDERALDGEYDQV
jgi:hypothetical protein